jgi:putative DNA primase/helicase
MQFVDFARLHGVIIDFTPPIGQWKRFKTEDKPTHRNGAVKFMGDHGFVQNHATMQEIAVWRSEGESQVGKQEIQRVAREASREIEQAQRKAAEKAEWILSQSELAYHPYFKSKGFPEELVNVWRSDKGLVAVIPMRIGRQIVGCQLIAESGNKKFLYGQRTSNAQFVFEAQGPHILCEGYATALSVRQALKNLKRKYTIHVCFSAHNLKKVAASLPNGVVIADNDASGTGERVAKEIGWPYWMSDRVGEDANDYAVRAGSFALSQSLRTLSLDSLNKFQAAIPSSGMQNQKNICSI